MSHFKVKSKRRDCDTTVTLDRKHIQNMDKIQKIKKSLSKNKSDLMKLMIYLKMNMM